MSDRWVLAHDPAVTGEAEAKAGTLHCPECGASNDGTVNGWKYRAQQAEARYEALLAAAPAAGAPPALVALVQEYQAAERAWRYDEMTTNGRLSSRKIAALDALLAWSPAPAPVAPPADHPDDYWISQRQDAYAPAPPAVAGGDAPEPVKCLDWSCMFPGGRCERICYWRRASR